MSQPAIFVGRLKQTKVFTMTYSQLTRSQRYRIDILHSMNFSQTNIASEIGVHKSTVCRELQRNTTTEGYVAQKAESLTFHRRKNAAKHTKHTPEMIRFIRDALINEQWSPEQISQMLEQQFEQCVSHEWIYRYVWQDKREGGLLYTHLRTRHKMYRKRYGSNARRSYYTGSTNISERPEIANQRQRIGDWEIDTVFGKQGQTVLVTAVDRKNKYLIMQLSPRKTSQAVLDTLLKMYKNFKRKVHTITCDNGAEFAKFRLIEIKLKTKMYFCDPYHSWQRGTNENTNGLIRQYFPKSINFDQVRDIEVKRVMDKLNRRPRKTLGFKTPSEVFACE